ncbi:pogo transposable element with KRAB domain-like protein [Aphelenchoides avenae]|nr:pogo transposable element with KRAB domain-like protein [Aphelenchus avenae]
MDGNGGLTIEGKGAKEVPILSTGHEKTNVTVMLTATSDGTPLKPFVLLKLKRPIKKLEDKFRRSLNLCWEGTNWMNNKLIELYLRATFKAPGFVQGKRLLVWDSFSVVLDDEDALLLDVSDSEGGEDSDSDASIESDSSSEDVTSQTRAQHAITSRCGAGCTYTPDSQ